MDRSFGVYDLARLHGVAITEAARRAGIAPSTIARWRRGSRPQPERIARLRAAIIDLARERGTHAERADAAVSELLRQAAALIERAVALVESPGRAV